MIVYRTRRIQPYLDSTDGNYQGLIRFARIVAPLISPGFNPPETWQVTEMQDEPCDFEEIKGRQGNEKQGYSYLHFLGYEPKACGQSVDRVVVEAVGLPSQDQKLEVECTRSWYDPRFLEIRVTAEESAVEQVLAAFDQIFGEHKRLEGDFAITSAVTSAIVAVRVGAWAAAEIWARLVLEVRPEEPDALFALGVARGAQGDLEGAHQYLSAAIEHNPQHYDAWYNLGNFHLEKNQPDKAVEVFRRSLEIMPDNHAVLYQLGRALEAAGDAQGALKAYQDAIRTSPNPDGAWGYNGMDFTQQAREAAARLAA